MDVVGGFIVLKLVIGVDLYFSCRHCAAISDLCLSLASGKYYSALDGADMNYGADDNGMGLTMGLGGMAGLGNYGTTLIEVNRILNSVPTMPVL